MLIYFAVDGGIANRMRSISVAPDGTAQLEVNGRASTTTLSPDAVQALTRQLTESGLFDRDRRYPAPGADLQHYQLRFKGATVVWYDTSMPAALQAPAAELDRVLRS